MSGRGGYWSAQLKQRMDREDLERVVPVPYRITTALDARGLYGPEVDRALGGEEPMVDLWESGDLVPTREQVEALAELTGYPVRFFYFPVTEVGGFGFHCHGEDGIEYGATCDRVWLGPPAPDAQVIPLIGGGA